MNKLVSKNPVLRFKEGRKIIKAQHGWGKYPGVPGLLSDYMYRMTYPSDTPLPGGMYLDNNTGNIYSTRINNDDEYFPISSPKVIQNGTYYETKDSSGKVIDRGRYFGGKKHSLPIGSSSSNKQSLEKILTTEASEKKLPLNKSNSQKTLSINNRKISFKQAFNNARNSGKQEFIWNGKRFNTKNKGEENYVFLNGKWIAPSVLLSNINLSELKTPIVSSITPVNNQEVANLNLNVPQKTYDRSEIRQFIRDKGLNPYSFTGALRRALRMVMNSKGTDNDKLLIKGMGLFKKGGQLPSRNIVERFKNKI